uniref:Uncharacterized protein n=1 Tax=uncultured marine virus TaxID=186617 RepID=A0A0F7L577_9VIRU|nr:hypothetical protein [uncultured marine virus]
MRTASLPQWALSPSTIPALEEEEALAIAASFLSLSRRGLVASHAPSERSYIEQLLCQIVTKRKNRRKGSRRLRLNALA